MQSLIEKTIAHYNRIDLAFNNAHFEQPYVKQVLAAYEVTLAEPIAAHFLRKIEP